MSDIITDEFFNSLKQILNSSKFENCNYPVYRGHANENFELLPTLHRVFKKTNKELLTLENNLYCDFRSLVGPSLRSNSSWETIFSMRHEGIPTRLLDWTENIGTALYFALNDKDVIKPHIWILNPFKLNDKEKITGGGLLNPEEDMEAYSKSYAIHCYGEVKFSHSLPIAVYPNRTNERLLAQRGLFSIHGEKEERMEDTCGDCLEKLEIPDKLIPSLKELIRYFGINSYSVYPDFKGLSTYLSEYYNY